MPTMVAWKKEDNKRKKEKHANLDHDEKEQLENMRKKGKKVMCHNLETGKKEQVRKIKKEIWINV